MNKFARKDLALNATYIWVAGGHLSIGTETAPFLQRATVTLYGDRWDTIELPHIGSKMLVVTNLGGLPGGCNSATPCTHCVKAEFHMCFLRTEAVHPICFKIMV